ncbi:Histone deacetylase hda1 [Mortierella sp. AM989]|nr:Histone deacetylase hda1 [Mortierella sp. AM989]
MIGSPLTLNIRNLLWHGFITPGDDIPLDAYGAMLIAVTMTIADGAKAKLNTPLTIRHLNPKSFYGQLPQQNQSSVPAGDLDSIFEALAYGPTLSLVDSQEVSEILHYLVSKSTFVTPGTAEQWIAACHHLNPDSGSSFVFIMSTLPLVEHALRLVYVAVNQCKLDRRSALIAGEYYLTLDVILDKVVPAEYYESDSAVLLDNEDHENIPNRLYSELGVPAMNLINDLFILGLGPRLRDRTSHGELNSYLTLDVTKETWFGYYAGLTIYLLHKYSSEISESISERIMRYISWKDQYFECRFDERSILKRETAHCQMLLAEYVDFVVGSRADVVRADNDSDVLNPEVGVEIILSLDGATVFSNKDSVSGHIPLESRLQSSLFSWSIVPSMSPTASMFSSNLPAWILIVQSIQGAIEKVTLKVRTLSEQLSLRQLSSRARKQFENMKPLIPRLLGMLIGCLAVVEHFVLTPPQRTPALSLLDGSSAEGGERLEAKLEGLSISASGKTSPSTLGLGNNSSGGATDKSSADEIMLRLKISTFIDKFVSNFDRVKLSSIEPAWEELAKCIEALPENPVLTNGDVDLSKIPSSPSSFSGSNNLDSVISSSSPRSSTSASAMDQDLQALTPTVDNISSVQSRIDNTDDSSPTSNATLQTIAPLPQPDRIGERSTRTGYVYDVRMRFHSNVHGDEEHPEDPRRIWKIFDALKSKGCISRMVKVQSREATNEELNYVHTADHINSITSTTDMSKEDLLNLADSYNSIYLNNSSAFCAKLSCGSLLELCKAVATGHILNGVAIVRPPGHHAEPDEAGGFCLYNNVAVAARYLQRQHGLKKIFILDWDVHHGNGTQKAFINDPDVVYCSIHRYDDGTFYPGDPVAAAHTTVGNGAGRGRNINIPWPCSGMGDSEYIYAFNKVVMPIVYEFAPDFVLVSAGFDAAKGDHIGENLVTPAAYGHMTHMLKSLAGGKIILALEGGYNLESIAVSGLACTKALLSDPIDALEPVIPNEVCVQTIHEVMEVQSRYWRSLTPMYIDPVDEGVNRNNVVEIARVLSVYRTEFLYQRHKMLKLPLSNPTYETDFLDGVHTTGEFCARTLGASNILRPDKSVLVDTVAQYVDKIVTTDNELIDIVVPYQPATEDERIKLKEKATELLTDIWDNYAVVSGSQRRIVLLAVGFGCHSLVSFMNERQKDVTRMVSCAVLVPGGDELLPIVTKRLSNWYMENSMVVVSDDHPVWERTNQKLNNRVGNLVRSGKPLEKLSDQLLYLYNTMFKQIDQKLDSLPPLLEDSPEPTLSDSTFMSVLSSLPESRAAEPSRVTTTPAGAQVHTITMPQHRLQPQSQQQQLPTPSITGYSSSSPASPSSPLVDRISLTTGNAQQRSQPYPPLNRTQQPQQPAIGSSSLSMHQYDQHTGAPHQQQQLQDYPPKSHSPQVYPHRQQTQNNK